MILLIILKGLQKGIDTTAYVASKQHPAPTEELTCLILQDETENVVSELAHGEDRRDVELDSNRFRS